MIRKVPAEPTEDLGSWLCREEALNLPLLGDIRRNGWDCDFQEFWVQEDEAGARLALIRRRFDHFIVYAPSMAVEFDEIGLFLRFSDVSTVSGRRSDVEGLLPFLDDFRPEHIRMMALPGDTQLTPCDADVPFAEGDPGMAGPEDADALGKLVFGTDAFRMNHRSADEIASGIRSRLKSGGVRHVVLRREGRIVSHAGTAVETVGFALLTGIATAPDCLRRGYAARLVSFLCRQLLAEGRLPCLFAKSDAALALYRRLGFEETGEYTTLRREAP